MDENHQDTTGNKLIITLRSWWQQIQQHFLTILIMAIFLAVVIALILIGYRVDWTGFNGNNKSGKTLWDWMQLLLVPIVLAIGGFWLNQIQKSREEETAKERERLERESREDNQQEAALQGYIDKMSELLLKEHLRESVSEKKPPFDTNKFLLKQIFRKRSGNSQIHSEPLAKDEVRTIARVRTLTVLSHLDGMRKRSVLRFLYEAGLIDKGKSILDLSGINFSGATLYGVDLRNADLSGAILCGANLTEASLVKANLWGTDLSNADLRNADLSGVALYGANLVKANLVKANLWETNLTGSNLTEANLTEAQLIRANLQRADLMRANLTGANLEEVNFRWADLSGANLKGATGITPEELEKQTKLLKGATMPDGSKHP